MAKKIYIVSSSDSDLGYELNEVLSAFSTYAKAKEFMESEKAKIDTSKAIFVVDEKDYYYAGYEHGWREIMIIEKELK